MRWGNKDKALQQRQRPNKGFGGRKEGGRMVGASDSEG